MIILKRSHYLSIERLILMKEYFTIQYQNWKLNWKKILIKLLIYIIGVFLFGMGIALYLNTRVGASHIDITNFAFIAILKGLNSNGSLSDLTSYATVLLIFYLCMLTVIVSLRATSAIINYKATHNKQIVISAVVNTILDLIPTFVWAYFVKLSELYIPVEKIGQINDTLIQTWIFIAGFLLYCFGITLTVFANLLFGPYNGLSYELHNLTKWNYKLCRVIVDFALMIVGIILILATTKFDWTTKEHWFSLYFGFGTIFMTFIAGPVIGTMLVWVKKVIKI